VRSSGSPPVGEILTTPLESWLPMRVRGTRSQILTSAQAMTVIAYKSLALSEMLSLFAHNRDLPSPHCSVESAGFCASDQPKTATQQPALGVRKRVWASVARANPARSGAGMRSALRLIRLPWRAPAPAICAPAGAPADGRSGVRSRSGEHGIFF
jgi:hypothetical protein